MSVRRVFPSAIHGCIAPPASKSAAHRALIAVALSGSGQVRGVIPSADMHATVQAVRALGVDAVWEDDTVTLSPSPVADCRAERMVDCLESGSTLRFFIPIFAALGVPAVFTGRGRLPERPLGVYGDCLPSHGVTLDRADGLPLTVGGRLCGGEFSLRGDISSQFITGLLFALPLCREDSTLHLTSPLQSAGYIDMTIDALAAAGIAVTPTADGWYIPGGQTYRPHDRVVESDWSQAAFLLAAGALGGDVTLTGLNPASSQGDREALALFRRFGADITETDGTITCRRAPLHGIDIDAAQIPDLVPILAVTAAAAVGDTRICNAGRLRIKESDRLAASADCLRRLGVSVEESEDALCIHGTGERFRGGAVSGYNDHRMVMSMAVAALHSDAPIDISDAEAVSKSWPSFFEDFAAIGGVSHGIEHR